MENCKPETRKSSSLPVFQGIEQVFEPIDLYLIHGLQQHTQLPGWKAFPRKPLQVRYREFEDGTAFVFTEGHFLGNEIKQEPGVG